MKIIVHYLNNRREEVVKIINYEEIADYAHKRSPHKIANPNGKRCLIVKPGYPDFYSIKLMTDEYIENALANIKEDKAKKSKQDRKRQYEKLKAEFGN